MASPQRNAPYQRRNEGRPRHNGARHDIKGEPVLGIRPSLPNSERPTPNSHDTYSSLNLQSTSSTAPSMKIEPDLALDEGTAGSSKGSNPLVFQRLVPTDIAPISKAKPPQTGRFHDMKESLAGFLRVISRTSRGEENIDDILTNAQESFKRAEKTTEPRHFTQNDDNEGIENLTSKRRHQERQRKYYVIDSRRSVCDKRDRSERAKISKEDREPEIIEKGKSQQTPPVKRRRARQVEVSEDDAGVGSDIEAAKIAVCPNMVSMGVDEESDMDPDEVDLDAEAGFKQASPRVVCKTRSDREIRAKRRAVEAEGGQVPADLMVNRKPALKEHKNEVTLKVREARKNTQYTFVKSRKAKLKDLREELELVAELPRHLKFELEYQKRAIRDGDTPASLGILYTGRFKAKRKEKLADDSSDDVTEVERKRQRRNLIKVTIQDEKGKKHDFQHDRDTKLGSMFRAFARLCQNDVLSYRFFFDGVRLDHDDKPADYDDFEDGAFIDAFFEAQGGASMHVIERSRPRFQHLFEI